MGVQRRNGGVQVVVRQEGSEETRDSDMNGLAGEGPKHHWDPAIFLNSDERTAAQAGLEPDQG